MLELIDLILGHRLYEFDCGHIFVNTNESSKRYRTLVDKKQLSKSAGATPAFTANWYDNYYPGRPKELQQYSLFNLMINFEIIGEKEAGKRTKSGSEDEDRGEKLRLENPFELDYHVNNVQSPFYCFPPKTKPMKIPSDDTKFMAKHRPQVRFFVIC